MAITEETIRKRLSKINTTQESIQTASLWILHYKDTAIDKVAKSWMDVYKKADDQLRMALIYVMNDVVQRANKSNTVKMAFHPHVVNACSLAGSSIKKPINRCIDIFAERRIFPSHIIEEMRAALGVSKKKEHNHPSDPEENFAEIDHSVVIREIESYCQNDELTEKARNILERSNFNFKEKMQDRMKDRAEGSKILTEMDESKNKLNQFLKSVERHQSKCQRLIELLKSAKSSLNLQFRDVTIVDDAYEKFASGILETKNQLTELLNSGALNVASPPRDAPSPLPTDDPFLHAPGAGDSGDDMEMDDDEDQSPCNSSLIPSKDFVAPVPTIPATSALDPRLQKMLNQNKMTLGASNGSSNQELLRHQSGADVDSRAAGSSLDPRQSMLPSPGSLTTIEPAQQQQSTSMSVPLPPMAIDTSHPPPASSGGGYFPGGAPIIPPNVMSPPVSGMMFPPSNQPPFPPPPAYIPQTSNVTSHSPGMMNFSMPPPPMFMPPSSTSAMSSPMTSPMGKPPPPSSQPVNYQQSYGGSGVERNNYKMRAKSDGTGRDNNTHYARKYNNNHHSGGGGRNSLYYKK